MTNIFNCMANVMLVMTMLLMSVGATFVTIRMVMAMIDEFRKLRRNRKANESLSRSFENRKDWGGIKNRKDWGGIKNRDR